MAQLDYRLLGSLEVRRHGEQIDLGAAKQRALLAILLLHANRVVSTDHLVEALWPKKPPGKPQTAVQGYVSQLRKLLEPERAPQAPFAVLVTESTGYRLRLDADRLDVHRVERLLKQASGALDAGRVGTASSKLTDALSLFRGPPLADFTYEQWAQQEIARLEELHLTVIESRVEAELARGRAAELVRELEALVQAQPLRERPRGQLMLALYRSGRQAEALEAYHQARARLAEELGIDPSPDLQTLYRRILNQDESLVVEASPHRPLTNLPAQTGRLFGRQFELEEITSLLRSRDSGIVTLTGPGGTGKTRLALRAAAAMVDEFADGVWFVGLGSLTDPELILPTVASTLGPQEDLADFLHAKDLLLVLDGLEQLLPAAATAVASLEPKVLATSRERLNVTHEQEYPVPTLQLGDATALFTARARQLIPTFEPDAAVETIAKRLDGLPLAIELAAARVKVLTTERIAARLGRSLELLAGGSRDVAERHRSLRATIEWSYALLGEDEQRLFARLAVFAGSFELEAAEAVCGVGIDALQALIEKSLLRQMGNGRYFMLETIKEFALERLEASTESEVQKRSHTRYFVDLAERAELSGSDQRAWLDRLELDHDNLRAALSWSREVGDAALALRLAAPLWRFWRTHNHLAEGIRVLEAVLQLDEHASALLRTRALLGASRLALDQGDSERSIAHAEEALAAARISGGAREIAAATENLGVALFVRDATSSEALALLEDSIACFRALGDPVGRAEALNNLGNALLTVGRTSAATDVLEEALALHRQADNKWGIEFVLHTLGYAALQQGELERARTWLEESLVLSEEFGHVPGIGWSLEGLAHVAAGRGDDHRALILWAAGEAVRAQAGACMQPLEVVIHEEALTLVRNRIGQTEADAAWLQGAAFSAGEAVAYALSSNMEARVPSRR